MMRPLHPKFPVMDGAGAKNEIDEHSHIGAEHLLSDRMQTIV